jgi:NTE family protein
VLPDRGSSDLDLTKSLNALESRFATVVFLADHDLTPWSERAIRQADELLIVAAPLGDPVGTTVALSPLESFALSLHRPAARRLVIVHRRRGTAQGTRHWLAKREPAMHHHIALGEADDVKRLWRFLTGEAMGLVACGGGAYCAAHIGVYRAFREAGISFDIIGGTSGGAAMGAAFAQDLPPLEIDARVHRMFIEGRALSRYTLPRYSLLDHAHFDAHLEKEFGNARIEDLWKPYYAISADLSNYEIEVHRTGPLWRAIRASAAIPGLLPPFYTEDGRMLVDGSVIANVPIETMHTLKRGQNVVVSFYAAQSQRFAVDYAALPKRRELIWRMLNPLARPALPAAPSAATVLVRSLMANRSHFERYLEPDDWLIVPPTPPQMGALDWRRHSEVMDEAYVYTRAALEARDLGSKR